MTGGFEVQIPSTKLLFCFNQQKMTEHRIKPRKFKIRTIPPQFECVECGAING